MTGRGSLAGNLVLLTTAVAAVAVLLAGLASWHTIRTTAEAQERDRLARQADVLSRTPALSSLLLEREQRLAGSNGVELAVVAPDGTTAGPAAAAVTTSVLAVLRGGDPASATAALGGRAVLVEGHPSPGGGAVVLTKPFTAVDDAAARIRGGLALPLAAGLAGAGAAGALLARRLARPLTAAARTAHRLAAGERGLALPDDGPAEVAELSAALTALDAALARSENRQRAFLLSVSHEIRTPLTAVRGYAEALADGVIGPDGLPATGRTLLAETGRLDRFVHDLLDLARLEADDFRLDAARTDLDALVEDAGAVWADRCARHDVRFRLERPGRPLPADTDPFRVRQLLDGLAENALRVTPAGRPLVLALRAEGGEAVFEVRDGGPGLTEDDLTVVFQRAALATRYRGVRPVGTGLGLAIAHRLTTLLGGTISAACASPEGGACFTVRLPTGA
ncbi:HAMP domain-containing histidine kinase [Streptomyces sp. NBC_00510]